MRLWYTVFLKKVGTSSYLISVPNYGNINSFSFLTIKWGGYLLWLWLDSLSLGPHSNPSTGHLRGQQPSKVGHLYIHSNKLIMHRNLRHWTTTYVPVTCTYRHTCTSILWVFIQPWPTIYLWPGVYWLQSQVYPPPPSFFYNGTSARTCTTHPTQWY